MNNINPHIGDTPQIMIGLLDQDGLPLDISCATVKQFHVRPPSGGVRTWIATMVGTGVGGHLYYDCLITDLNIVGEWRIQAYVEIPIGKVWHSDTVVFQVLESI